MPTHGTPMHVTVVGVRLPKDGRQLQSADALQAQHDADTNGVAGGTPAWQPHIANCMGSQCGPACMVPALGHKALRVHRRASVQAILRFLETLFVIPTRSRNNSDTHMARVSAAVNCADMQCKRNEG